MKNMKKSRLMPDSYAEEIAEGVLNLMLSDDLFSVFVDDGGESCSVIWSCASVELLEARVQEVLDA